MSNGSNLAGVDLDIVEVLNSATSEILNGHSDWSANMQIVDHINAHPENAKQILELVKKRVSSKKNEIALSSLSLLEALVKNCSASHPFVAEKSFLESLVKSLPKRVRDPTSKSLFKLDSTEDMIGMERIDRTLVILQSWGIAFATSKSYPIFAEIYRGLQMKGVKFPEPDKNETAPVFTPAKRTSTNVSASSSSSSSTSASKQSSKSSSTSSSTPASSRPSKPAASASATASGASSASSSSSTSSSLSSSTSSTSSPPAATSTHVKFKDSECQVAWDSTILMMEMASAATSFHELQANEIVTELLSTVQRLQKTMSTRLGTDAALTNESLMAELLCANDAVVAGLSYLQQLAKGKIKMGTKPPQPTPPHSANANANTNGNSTKDQKAQNVPAPSTTAASSSPPVTAAAAATPAPAQPATFDFFSGMIPSSTSSPSQPQGGASASPSRVPATNTPPLAPSPSNPSPAMKGLLPPPPGSGGESKRRTKKDGAESTTPKATASLTAVPAPAPASAPTAIDPLDLLFAGTSSSSQSTPSAKPATAASAAPAAASTASFDLFAAFGAPAPVSTPAVTAAKKTQDDDDPFLALAARK